VFGPKTIFAAILCSLLGVFVIAPCERTTVRMGDVTGTRHIETVWFGVFRKTHVEESPLALWCVAHGVQVNETKKFCNSGESGLLGKIADGRPPAIMSLMVGHLQEFYLSYETEYNIRQFISKMSAADEKEKQKLVDELVEAVTRRNR
jgi:hypothetical protein